MKLFHWISEGINLLVMAESEESARAVLLQDVAQWRWQNPDKFDKVAQHLTQPPYFVAEPGHVITVGNAR